MPGNRSTPTSPLRRGAVTLLMLAAGLAILAWTVRRLDVSPADFHLALKNIGPWFAAILLLSFLRFVLRSYAWVVLTGLPIPLRSAVAATISGDALGNVTPLLGPLASEPAKALYLRRYADPSLTLAALVAENFFYSVSVALYVIVAGGAMFFFFDLPPAIHTLGLASLGGMAAVLAGATWMAWQKPALLSGLMARFPIKRVSALSGRIRQFEQQTYGAGRHNGLSLFKVGACEAGFHVLSLAECWLTFWLLAGVESVIPALVFDGFNRVINVVGKPIPFRVGVEEGGTALLAAAIGLAGPDGFMLGIVRKLRVVVWAAVGMVLWARVGSVEKSQVTGGRSSPKTPVGP